MFIVNETEHAWTTPLNETCHCCSAFREGGMDASAVALISPNAYGKERELTAGIQLPLGVIAVKHGPLEMFMKVRLLWLTRTCCLLAAVPVKLNHQLLKV